MPLFGKKKKGSTGDGASYPKQQKPYPTQPAYPVQQPAYPVQQPAYPVQQQPGTSYQAPPPYNPDPSYPSQPPPVQPYPQPGQHTQYQPQPSYPVQSAPPQPRQSSGLGNDDVPFLLLATSHNAGTGLVAAAALSSGYNTQFPICPQSSVPQPIVPPDQNAAGVYDQGARFDPNKRPSLPPPPPGVAPTQAQMAASQGQTVVMSQQKKDSWGMGSDGGVAFF